MAKSKNFGRKKFFDPKTLKKRDFWAKNGEKRQSQKNLVEIFFWSESIQNVLKRISKRKSQNRKFFPITKFFRGTQSFFAQNNKNGEKMAKSKILVENFFWSESIQNVLKRILKRKSRNLKFLPVTKFFPGT